MAQTDLRSDEVEEDVVPLSEEKKRADSLFRVPVRRDVDGVFHGGVVESIEIGQLSQERLYVVRYGNGDIEHMTREQVVDIKAAASSAATRRAVPSAREAAASSAATQRAVPSAREAAASSAATQRAVPSAREATLVQAAVRRAAQAVILEAAASSAATRSAPSAPEANGNADSQQQSAEPVQRAERVPPAEAPTDSVVFVDDEHEGEEAQEGVAKKPALASAEAKEVAKKPAVASATAKENEPQRPKRGRPAADTEATAASKSKIAKPAAGSQPEARQQQGQEPKITAEERERRNEVQRKRRDRQRMEKKKEKEKKKEQAKKRKERENETWRRSSTVTNARKVIHKKPSK
eukprot:TRINITY_DN9713_c0_g1_i4.p1 TRINITY_DN9713_c0_g1~~TRINITY_DN9713_c0_g1_i4.p1  ORF type:complete len:351 (-),score=86.97 TRINITY_DN9713_c0_g1_i4:398-1450(-)